MDNKNFTTLISNMSSVLTVTNKIFENKKARGILTVNSPTSKMQIGKYLAFEKVKDKKEIAEEMWIALKNGFSVQEIANLAECSVSTVYRVTKSLRHKNK